MRSVVPVTLVAACTVLAGCSRSNDQENAKLRAELDTARAKIARLEGELARHKDGDKKTVTPKSRLIVVRGLRINWEYPVYEGKNIIGRADQQPVDIDLQPQEREDRVWSSRQHAAINCNGGLMTIEDLNSSNGTYVNRERVAPRERRKLQKGDIIQIGEVQLKVLE
jgi:hypothetical protein